MTVSGIFKRGEVVRHFGRQELRAEFLGVEQQRIAERRWRAIRDSCRRARREQPPEDVAAVVRERDDGAADLLAAHAGGIGRADAPRRSRCRRSPTGRTPISSSASSTAICASARAPPPPSASATRFHRAPASRAKRQAVSASGRTICALAGACSLVAVPSRTRPAMPCRIAAMRKKL